MNNNSRGIRLFVAAKDVVPVLSYADPDPPNLVNVDPDPGRKITKFFKKSKIILN